MHVPERARDFAEAIAPQQYSAAQQPAAAFCSLCASCVQFCSQTHLFIVEVVSRVAANEKSKRMHYGEQVLLTLLSLRWVNDVGYRSLLIVIIVSVSLYIYIFWGQDAGPVCHLTFLTSSPELICLGNAVLSLIMERLHLCSKLLRDGRK